MTHSDKNLSRTRRAITLLLLLTALASAGTYPVAPGRAHPQPRWASGPSRQPRDKVSPGLRERMRGRRQGGEKVSVILRLGDKPTGRLNALLKRGGVHVKGDFESFDSMAVELPAETIEELAGFSEVEVITPDEEVKFLGFVEGATGAREMRGRADNSGLRGKDMNIAVLDSGVDKDHHGAGDIAFQKDFTGEGTTGDPYGHGTHVASLAAAPNHIANGAYTGLAPEAKIINLRVLNSQGVGSTSAVLKALQWILAPVDSSKPAGEKNYQKYRIRVVNMSIGAPAIDSYTVDPLCLAVRRLVDAGVVVVAAAGNDGTDASGQKFYGRIHSPGNEPSAITVGASNTLDTESRADDLVTTYSSRGPTRSFRAVNGERVYDHIIKPDLVAPGNKLIAAEAAGNAIVARYSSLAVTPRSNPNHKVMLMSGTSMATPLVAGAVSVILQANPQLTPNMVKMVLQYTAQPLPGFNTYEQGAGQLNLDGAVQLAKLIRTDLTNQTPLGAPLLVPGAVPPAPYTTIAGHRFPGHRACCKTRATSRAPTSSPSTSGFTTSARRSARASWSRTG